MKSSDNDGPSPARASGRHRHRWLLRGAAVLVGLSVFVLAEGVCWLFGIGTPDLHDDPFVGFNDLQPLFVLDAQQQRYHVAPARLKFFVEDSFPVPKPAGTLRIFCLGGSTVQGRPFAKETSFTTWLQLALSCADPTRHWEVINCGGVSYASYRLVPVMLECLNYEPDMFILCTGQNEFLEDRTYGALRDQPALIARTHHYLTRLRTYQLYRQLLLSVLDRKPQHSTPAQLGSDVDAMLDYHNGIRAYHRDPQWRSGVIAHFRYNVQRMVDICATRDLPLILMIPPSNLADTPPFKSEHQPGLTSTELKLFQQAQQQARTEARSAPFGAVPFARRAVTIDPEYASANFELGIFLDASGRHAEARSAFIAARDTDICPLRILSPMERALAAIAEDSDVPCLDVRAVLAPHTAHGTLDGSVLVDHVHPSIESHRLIALALTRLLAAQHTAQLGPNWEAKARRTFADHFAALPKFYFVRGQQRLHALHEWAIGNADGPPIESRFPQLRRSASHGEQPPPLDDGAADQKRTQTP